MAYEKFNYKDLDEFKKALEELNIKLPISEDLDILKIPIKLKDKTIPNSLAVQPMEGCDGTYEGKPDVLTYRRYERFSKGGAGLLWCEATAVVSEGRANPRQLYINDNNKEDFKKLHELIIASGKENFGKEYKPYTVLQLTHSGRYSRLKDKPAPIIGINNPYLDRGDDLYSITDEELDNLKKDYVKAAILARDAGFDAVDIKSCHRYLISELLSCFGREGKYGGSFENRTRFLIDIIDNIKLELKDTIDVTLRLNAFDAIPYPYGWGVDKENFRIADLSEPIKLVKLLYEKGVKLIDISCGNPYYNPHIGRPYDIGSYVPPANQLKYVFDMLNIIRQIQAAVPDMVVVATGFSWLREFGANVAAGCIKEGWFKVAGFGRQAFAYPSFAKDIFEKGQMERGKCCIACSKCSEIMRDGGKTGCVIRDSKTYMPIYEAGRLGKPTLQSTKTGEHI